MPNLFTAQVANLKKHWKVVIPLVVFTLIYLVFYSGGLTAPRLSWPGLRIDERLSLNVALDPITYSIYGPYDISGPSYQKGPGGFWAHPPLYYFLISPIAPYPILCRLFSFSLAYLSLILVYLLTEKHFGHGGFVSATALAFIPSMITRGDVITMDMLFLTFVLLTLLFQAHGRYRAVLICCALGINIKYPFVIVLLPLATEKKRVFFGAFLTMTVSLLPFGLWSMLRANDFLMLKTWITQSSSFYTFYKTPGIHWLLLAGLTGLGLIRRRLTIERELPFLLLIFGNIIQFYATPLRHLYYLFPSYAVLSVMAGSYAYLESRQVAIELWHRYLIYRQHPPQ